ncbi:ATPase family AAA domain-containing protein 1-B-like protein [Dinothrombium tinctorium]|uniref:ATPase family AAA domain-containing protein 1-B-like protein n=1 Tax=Dinothrombium tinctorium TaxID=1965070 RepID=A0A3S3P1N4_9ACAR|nr:ATPase family AAA domain-containing protein 1-B-like protein [Dinothrombium tinctorium]RWS10120.1 ATPase family AAA domain-containing protein 1-B-like protein [Dinothrombium tinctorium]
MSLSRSDIIALFVRAAILAKERSTRKGLFSSLFISFLLVSFSSKAEKLLSRFGLSGLELQLSEYEMSIAAQLVDPQSIDVSWSDIAGLNDIIEDLKATIILPLRTPQLFIKSQLHQPPKGVLLHGPPGCGKTMIAKATAKEAGARFINLEVPALTDKWYGESQKLAAAVFTLALKLQPCIIFIDEIDSFLRSRDSHDHEATAMMKAQFMILWDGLVSAKHCQVIVMGATNRPQDVDKAILRRMPAMFQISLPTREKRIEILKLVLKQENISADIDYNLIANMTEGFSGSDLKELCRAAAMVRVRELCMQDAESNDLDNLRSIKMDDFLAAIHKTKESKIMVSSAHSVIGLD